MQARLSSFSSEFFRVPHFLKGIARILDSFGTLDQYNHVSSKVEEDKNAIKKDWEMIGYDLWSAIKDYESNTSKTK